MSVEMAAARLHPADLELLADLVAARLAPMLAGGTPAPPAESELLTAAQVAELLGMTRDSVYRRCHELGAIRIGDGARPRLRFVRAKVLAALPACSASRTSELPSPPRRQRSRPRLAAIDGTPYPLLPIGRPAA